MTSGAFLRNLLRIPARLWNFDRIPPVQVRAESRTERVCSSSRANRNNPDLIPAICRSGSPDFFPWFFLLLVLASSVFLSLFIARATTATLLDSQEDYALLLAENLNKQIFNRFTLPVTVASGRVKLGDPEQYRLLDEVVHSLLHGLRVETIRIYNNEYAVTYSTNRDEVRRTDLYTQGVPEIFSGKAPSFRCTFHNVLLSGHAAPAPGRGSFQLRTIYPLKITQELYPNLSEEDASTVLGLWKSFRM